MSKTVLFIATSIDGFIAKPDGNLEWLTSFPPPQKGDYGYSDLLQSIEATIMGRKTYEEIIGFGMTWPYKEYDSYVVTSDTNYLIKSENTFAVNGDLKDFILTRKKKAQKDIWLIGGGQLVTKFINEKILDKMIITIIPKILGEGIPLFPGKPAETNWKLMETIPYDTGAVTLIYEKNIEL